MTPKQFNAALKKLKISVYASPQYLGISLRQAQRYSAGEQEVSHPVANHLKLLLQTVEDWRKGRDDDLRQIAFFDRPGTSIQTNGVDDTAEWVAELRDRVAEWESLLNSGGEGIVPAQEF